MIEAFDTPSVAVPVLYNRKKQGQNQLDSVDLDYDFELYIIAATIDVRNGANSVFVQQAEAEGGWHWTVNQNSGAPATNYQFVPNAQNRVQPPTGWIEATSGLEQDENEPWALPTYQDLRHWLG